MEILNTEDLRFRIQDFLNGKDEKLLLHLVDVVWMDSKESTEVPATSHAKELIQKAFELLNTH